MSKKPRESAGETPLNNLSGRFSSGPQKLAFLAILLLSVFLVVYIHAGYVTPAVIGMIIAGAFYPLLNWLILKTGWSRKVLSSLVSILIFLIIILPVVFITIELTKEVFKVYEYLQSGETSAVLRNILFGDHFLADALRWLSEKTGINYTPEEIEKWIIASLKSVLMQVFNSLNKLAGDIFSFLLSLILMQIFIYVLFLEGPEIRRFVAKLFPMEDSDEEAIFSTINTMNFTTLLSNGIGGLMQGILAGIGFWIAGFESVVLWTIIMVILAFIPLVGISIVSVPASIFLFFTGKPVEGIILLAYCALVSLIVENWFKPMFMGKRVQINPFLVFFSIIGGMSAFGFLGIFYGPIIIAVFLTVTDLYLKKTGQSIGN